MRVINKETNFGEFIHDSFAFGHSSVSIVSSTGRQYLGIIEGISIDTTTETAVVVISGGFKFNVDFDCTVKYQAMVDS